MSALPVELSDIFSSFESTTEPFSLWDLADNLETFRKDNPALTPDAEFALRAELFAFEFVGRREGGESPWGTYFGPKVTFGGRCIPDIRSLDEDFFTYWKYRFEEAQHPRLKARYADLLWDLTREAIGQKPDYHMALAAIDFYIADLEQTARNMEHVFRLERALNLATSLNKSDKTKEIVERMFTLHEDISEPDKMGWCWTPLTILYKARKRANLSDEQVQEIISRMDGFLQQWSDPDSGHFNPSNAREAGRELAQIYRSHEKQAEAQRAIRTSGRAVEHFAASVSPLVGSAWLEKLHQDYLETGLRTEADRLLGDMRELGAKAAEEMKPMTSTVEIPTDEVDAHINSLLDGGIDACWNKICVNYTPREESVRSLVQELKESAPLFSMLNISVGDELPRTKIGGVQDDEDGRFFFQVSMQMSLGSLFLSQIIEQMFKRYALSVEDFVDRLYLSPIFDAERRAFLTCGVERYRSGDFVSATHVLLPQIEHLLRTLLGSFGGAISVRKDGVFREKDLGAVLSDPVMQQCCQTQGIEDVRRYLQALLTEQRGWNMRNQVCHGLPSSPGWFTQEKVAQLVHVLMILSLFRASENSLPNDGVEKEGEV